MSTRRVVVSGFDVVSPYGVGKDLLWSHISRGESAARQISSFDTTALPVTFAAQLPLQTKELADLLERPKSAKTVGRSGLMLLLAAQLARTQAELDRSTIDPFRVGTSMGAGGLGNYDVETFQDGLVLSAGAIVSRNGNLAIDERRYLTSMLTEVHPLSPLKGIPNIPTALVTQMVQARAVSMTLSTACISSAQAIGEAFWQIRTDQADVMVCGGADAMVNPTSIILFYLLGVLSRRNDEFATASRPFSADRDGFMLGEGGAVFILEELEHCLKRGATPICELVGYGTTADAYRLTDPSADSSGTIEAMRRAMKVASIDPTEVDHINAHGTGTLINDAHETRAIKAVFADHAYRVPITANKSLFGHGVAAAGAIELAAAIQSMIHNTIPPTKNLSTPDLECDLDYTANSPRQIELTTIMSNSFGFGGQNASLIIRRIP